MIEIHLCAERKEVDEPIFLCKWPFWKCSDISTHTQMFNLAHISLRPPLSTMYNYVIGGENPVCNLDSTVRSPTMYAVRGGRFYYSKKAEKKQNRSG